MNELSMLAANPGKQLIVEVGGKKYARYAVKTHFVAMGEDLADLVRRYVLPHYRPGDILSMSEKIVSLCQRDVILKQDMKVGRLARLLSRFAYRNPAGPAMDNVYKMQAAIRMAGPARVLLGAVLGGIGKLFGKKGLFYNFVGHGVRNIDGFCVVGYDYYADKGIMAPSNPDLACQKIEDEMGVTCMVVDANDISVQILGVSRGVEHDRTTLAALIRDNPSGQGRQQTPFILIREAGPVPPKAGAVARPGTAKYTAKPGKAARSRFV